MSVWSERRRIESTRACGTARTEEEERASGGGSGGAPRSENSKSPLQDTPHSRIQPPAWPCRIDDWLEPKQSPSARTRRLASSHVRIVSLQPIAARVPEVLSPRRRGRIGGGKGRWRGSVSLSVFCSETTTTTSLLLQKFAGEGSGRNLHACGMVTTFEYACVCVVGVSIWRFAKMGFTASLASR